MKNIPLKKIAGGGAKLILLLLVMFSCTQDPVLWKINSEEQVIAEYVLGNPENYTEFGKLLESTNLTSLLSTRGPYTLFLPNDNAMKTYYQVKQTSFEQLDNKAKLRLIYNHLILNEIGSGDITLGAIRDTNAIGDFLVTEFAGSDIIVNKHSKIIDRDIRAANGYIHEIDQVIDPVTISAYDYLVADPSYSIFAEGLKMTGLKDTLQTISFPYGKKQARTRFTILAVDNETFAQEGIKNVNELVAKYTNRPDSVKFLQNGFYRYMEYHCLGGTYYLSGLETKLYPILSYDNNILITVDNDYKLNLDKNTGEYTGFNIEKSNIPAKNGAIHTINKLLPVIIPDPTVITFETTDYFDLKQGDYYGKYYMKWSDGQNTFAKIKWGGDYLQYYYKNHDAPVQINWDCLNMNGFWWVEITTPKVMKGKYKLSGYVWSGNIDFEVYVDGVKSALINKTDPDRAPWGEFIWDKTEEHKIKLVNVSWGTLFWDTVIFTPID